MRWVRIQVTVAVRERLGAGCRFSDERVIHLKGKGDTTTWFLLSRNDSGEPDRYPRAGL